MVEKNQKHQHPVVVFLNSFGDGKTPMSDEDKDARRVGRDEMNLSEYPVTLLTERVPPGCKTITFKDRHGTLTVTGSDDYGLPAASDSDVIVALLHKNSARGPSPSGDGGIAAPWS